MLSTLLAPVAAARWCFVLSAGSVLIFTSCDRQRSTSLLAPDQAQLAAEPKATPLSFSAIDAGSDHTCAVTASGKGYCWGLNVEGQLGNGARSGQEANAKPVAVEGGLTFSAISAGHSHTCALESSTGNAYCWGSDGDGQIGSGDLTRETKLVPVAVARGLTFSAISAGSFHTCALESGTGRAYCWGSNSEGQLGNGTFIDSPVPIAVAGELAFSAISAGSIYTCALESGTGRTYCWGYNLWQRTRVPGPLFEGYTFSAISLGDGRFPHMCALGSSTGKGYCWGDNHTGQLGDGTTLSRQVPVAVAGELTFSAISAGSYHTCALELSKGKAHCWGDNNYGQLGNDTTTDSTEPMAVAGGRKYTAISAGYEHTCALESRTGNAYCWGVNQYGQLGNDGPSWESEYDRAYSTKPVAVVAP